MGFLYEREVAFFLRKCPVFMRMYTLADLAFQQYVIYNTSIYFTHEI